MLEEEIESSQSVAEDGAGLQESSYQTLALTAERKSQVSLLLNLPLGLTARLNRFDFFPANAAPGALARLP